MSKATDSGRFLCSSTHMILIPRSCTRGCMQTDCTVSSYKKLLGIHEDTQAVLMRKFLIFCGTLIHWELAWALSREYDFFSRKPCFSLNMVGFGSPRQPRKKSAVKTPVKEAPPVDKTPLPNAPTAAGELPYDAFSQFPPLSPQNQASLRKVDGENDELTPEVLVQVRERHGFKSFNDKLFPTIRLLHGDPVVFEVEDFFTPEECDTYVRMSTEAQSGQRKGGFKSKEIRSATTSAQSQFQQHRTSTTWFHHYASAPELLAKASALLGVEDYRLWEEPQTVRYRPGERFNWHLDALPPSETGASKGGQRTATILVYLTDVDGNAGGATAFRDLGPLRVRPKKGKCLVFFPSFGGEAGCPFDVRTLHAGEVLGAGKSKLKEKYIAQLWCHKKPYPPSVPPGSSHEAATEYIADYNRRWGGKSKLDTSTET